MDGWMMVDVDVDDTTIEIDVNNDSINNHVGINDVVTNRLLDDALAEKRRPVHYSYTTTTAYSASCDGDGETRISTTCVELLRRRMELDPSLRYLDAVRMIGLNNVNDIFGDEDDIDKINNNNELYVKVDEIDHQGLFETATEAARGDIRAVEAESEAAMNEDDDMSYYQPTTTALQFGRQVQQLFLQHNYKYQTCRDRYLMIPQLSDDDDEEEDRDRDDQSHNQNQNQNHRLLVQQNHHRIYSGQSFFAHRHELFDTKTKVGRHQQRQLQRQQMMNNIKDHDGHDDYDSPDVDDFTTPLDVLVWLFLFGLGLELSVVVEVLGEDNIKLLMNAHLLDQFGLNTADSTNNDPEVHETIGYDEDDDVDGDGCRERGTTTTKYLVGRVQIYPIDIEMFIPSPFPPRSCHSQHDERHLLMMTDWPMESLRSTLNAIMSIG
mmetsp:Transcript_26457/g.62977  ORF Transcript_26457/g.62977 Transcript_26457/m.62977 type:complete len:436 (+) Transcript_26457:212-1519(+)